MRFMIVVLFLSLSASAYAAGPELTLEKAVQLFYENNPEVNAARISLQRADADVFEFRAWPNPVAKYFRETMGDGQKTVEETYSLSQEVDLIGRRGKKADAAEKRRSAQGHLVEQETADRLAEMKRSYFRILLLQESKKTTGETLSYYSDTEGKMRARVSTGDISEADLMKMMIERRKAERRVEELRVELAAEKARLGVLLGISVSDVSLSGGLPYEPVYPTMDETVERALENRSELKGRSMLIQASESALSAEKRSIMPAFEVEGGYRKNSDGFTGAVFGISVPLPLFDRNRGGTVRARAEMHAARLAVETGKKRLIADVSGLVNSILSIQTRIAALEEQVALSRSLIGIARLAYEEGESSLLDFLYTMRSGQDLAAEYHTALYEHASSIAEFEALTGFNTANGGVK